MSRIPLTVANGYIWLLYAGHLFRAKSVLVTFQLNIYAMKISHFTAILFCLMLAACGPKKSEESSPEAEVAESTPPSDEENAIDDASDSTSASEQESKPSPAVGAAAAATASASKNTFTDSKGRTVYNTVENPPAFSGGESEMNKWLRKNLKYPETDAEGTVFVSFVVGDDGGVSETKVESGAPDQKLRDEALRVVSAMPKWTPGKQGGKSVPVKFTLPVTFKKSV